MRKLFLAITVIIICNYTNAQEKDTSFEKSASELVTKMNDANVRSDVNSYLESWNSFQAQYNKLTPKQQKTYSVYFPSLQYNLACTYAKVGNDKKAFEVLAKSGYQDYGHISEDGDWVKYRNDPRFISFCNSIKKHSKLGVLQSSGAYSIIEKKELPAFTYQDSSNENLKALRKQYKLDSIAGTGSEALRVINLMHWIHNLIPHDGNKNNPAGDKSALHYIETCTKNNGTLNCRGLAISLNEIYLAMGFKSRYVTCMPKDSIFDDCHVINSVYLPSLKKWVWMDPTNDAYVMNEKGELLGIQEVRERLIEGKPLILNPDANWNNKSSQTRSGYLENYMAKNLYRIECNVDNSYNSETAAPNKFRRFVQLVPSDLKHFKDEVNKNKEGNPTYAVYFTTNADKFWTIPN